MKQTKQTKQTTSKTAVNKNQKKSTSKSLSIPTVAPLSLPLRANIPTDTTTSAASVVYMLSDSSGNKNTEQCCHTNDTLSNDPATIERQERNRRSWLNMRRKCDNHDLTKSQLATTTTTTTTTITPSPQTMRSYITAGTGSGRTTATSGRMSSSGVATISGSSNTLNDIISDYHSQNGTTNASEDFQHTHHHHSLHPHHPHMNHSYAGSSSTPTKNYLSNGSFNTTANGSTVKLLPATDDAANQQTKCSVFRGLVLCICLNVTYANIVRFPRELDKYGSAYLVPYVTLLFLVGLPIILLEIALGQFLGQGAAHTWRASPIFKGACIIGRFASWLSTVYVSLQAVMSLGYIAMFIFNTMPFRECVGSIKMERDGYTGYTVTGNSGQECLLKTFLLPFWENPFFYGVLSIGLVCIWIVVMLCTHNSRVLRRSLFIFGLLGFALLCTLTGWEVRSAFQQSYFPELWPFDSTLLYDSNIWFNALMQVLFATNCGFGALPMLTGKFLYKGDAVRTSVVYLCFNLLINAIAVTLFMIQFGYSANGASSIDELKPLTTIYDRILYSKSDTDSLAKLIPAAIYIVVVLSAIVTIIVSIYTATRLVPRHPNYFISLIALVMSIISFAAPRFMIARILDTRIIGTMIITALIFDLIAVTWIYGAKNIYTDLEFSIGRPIFKGWMFLWYICPAILTGLLVWWCSDDDEFDLLAEYVPRWAPILFVLAIICVIACIQIFRQVEYNFFGMICEASKPAKEWGPADPLARHAWKQWRSVCQDTGRRDFTLRRRGTRDYTHSIKNTAKYANGQATQSNWKSTTPGNSSPNYSGSMFGDSAIEEDISVDKFPGVSQQFVPFQQNTNNNNSENGKSFRYSQRTQRAQQQQQQPQQQKPTTQHQHPQQQQQQSQLQRSNQQQNFKTAIYPNQSHEHLTANAIAAIETHREVVYIRRLSSDNGQQHSTRIEITPSNECITYAGARNPLGRIHGSDVNRVKRSASASGNLATGIRSNSNSTNSIGVNRYPPPPPPPYITSSTAHDDGDHVCWRKFANNAGTVRHEDATVL